VAAVWDLEASCIAETRSVVLRVPVDYDPGLLGFREGPLVVAAAKALRGSADVFLTLGMAWLILIGLDLRATLG